MKSPSRPVWLQFAIYTLVILAGVFIAVGASRNDIEHNSAQITRVERNYIEADNQIRKQIEEIRKNAEQNARTLERVEEQTKNNAKGIDRIERGVEKLLDK